MARPQQRLLSQLATSPNEIASGLGQCLEALRLIAALPRASPVYVHYASAPSTTIRAFGRDHLARVPLRTALALIRTSLALADPVRVSSARFYREDGTLDGTPVQVDEGSWRELAPYVHTLHVEDDVRADPDADDAGRPATALSTLSAISATTVAGASAGSASASAVKAPAGLNSNASAFVPAANGITIKTGDGAMVSLPGLRKASFSPSSPQATSPFAFLDSAGTSF